MKFTSIFFTASARNIGGLPQISPFVSEKYEVYFDIFHSECQKNRDSNYLIIGEYLLCKQNSTKN